MCQDNDNGPQKHANDCEHHAPAKRFQERGRAEPDGTKRQAFAEPDNEEKRDRADDSSAILSILRRERSNGG